MIFVNGGKEYQRKRVTDLAWFVCKKFNMEPILDINIRDLTSEGSLGFCTEFDEGEYEIDVNKSLHLRELLITLAHELVHVKQYERGEMERLNDKDVSYWDRPSEIEAHDRELGLFIQWVEDRGLSKRKWTQRSNG